MSYDVKSIPLFDLQAKRLSKKYPSLKQDLAGLIVILTEKPEQGSAPGNHFYKIRLSITSKSKGKSGGARVITYLKIITTTVYLISIYDKSERGSITTFALQNKYHPNLQHIEVQPGNTQNLLRHYLLYQHYLMEYKS